MKDINKKKKSESEKPCPADNCILFNRHCLINTMGAILKKTKSESQIESKSEQLCENLCDVCVIIVFFFTTDTIA